MRASFKFVDRPKASLKIGSLLFTAAAAFMFWKAVGGPAPTWALSGSAAFFVLGCVLTAREFLYRPLRVTTIEPGMSELVVEEIAPLRQRRIVAQISKDAQFETYECDSDVALFGVRVKDQRGKWIVLADYLSKRNAESLAAEANAAVRLFPIARQ